MTTLATTSWYGCPDPDRCDDTSCTNPEHMPTRDVVWSEADELASWLEDDTRARARSSRRARAVAVSAFAAGADGAAGRPRP